MNTPVRNYFDTLVSNHHYCTAKRQKCLQFTCQIMLPQFSVGMLGLDFMLIEFKLCSSMRDLYDIINLLALGLVWITQLPPNTCGVEW